jgi:hypothetical protein
VAKAKRSRALLDELLAEKSAVLSQAQALTAMGMGQSAQPLWASAAALEERIAPLLAELDHLGRAHQLATGYVAPTIGVSDTRSRAYYRRW